MRIQTFNLELNTADASKLGDNYLMEIIIMLTSVLI